MRILILKPSSLGDVIQALPVLRLLKRHYPDSSIYWWISAELFPLLEGDPDLAGLFPFYRRGWQSPSYWKRLFEEMQQMRHLQFDLVIDLQSLARSALISWFAKGQLTIGLDDPREGAQAFYDIAIPRTSYHTHAVDWYLAVLKALQVPVNDEFVWLPSRAAVVENMQAKWLVKDSQWVAIHPGARWINKRWPVEYYAATLKELAERKRDLRFVVLGGGSDAAMGRQITQAAPDRCLDLTGKTSIPEMIEWVRFSSLMLTNDTGPMHVAAAMRRPLIALFGPTEPRRTGPYRGMDSVLSDSLPCAPCMQSICHHPKPLECMRKITPASVVERALQILKR